MSKFIYYYILAVSKSRALDNLRWSDFCFFKLLLFFILFLLNTYLNCVLNDGQRSRFLTDPENSPVLGNRCPECNDSLQVLGCGPLERHLLGSGSVDLSVCDSAL